MENIQKDKIWNEKIHLKIWVASIDKKYQKVTWDNFVILKKKKNVKHLV